MALQVPLPRTISAIGEHHRLKEEPGSRILTPRLPPSPDLEGHLTFALKYEGLDLAILDRLFGAVDAKAIEVLVRDKPIGSYARRIWFLYEWLKGKRLNLSDAEKGSYVPVVDPEQQYAADGENSPRHRVRGRGVSRFGSDTRTDQRISHCFGGLLPMPVAPIHGSQPPTATSKC
jgi:hypothetical protein